MDKQKKFNEPKEIKDARKLDSLFNDSMSSISPNIFGGTDENENVLAMHKRKIDNIIDAEINNTKSIVSDEMSTFFVKLFAEQRAGQYGGNDQVKSLSDIFSSNETGLNTFFEQRYRNNCLKYDDLDLISSQLFELNEAVMATRDAIITADDLSQTISRNITFKGVSDTAAVTKMTTVLEDLEVKYGLQKRLKNQVIPETLRYGDYWVYCIPHSKLFEEQYAKLKKSKHELLSEAVLQESMIMLDPEETVTEADRNYVMGYANMHNININQNNKTSVTNYYNSLLEHVSIVNDSPSIPLFEGVDVSSLMDTTEFEKTVGKAIKDSDKKGASPKFTEGVGDLSKNPAGLFDKSVKGVHIKCTDPKTVIEIKVIDTVLGYYYVHPTALKMNQSPFSTAIRVTNRPVVGSGVQATDDNAETAFLSKIADKIVKKFDKPYLEHNEKFKELILNALIFHDIHNNNIQFQFIPKEYMIKFTVNDDGEGNGESILMKSLFYSKLYLALLIFKMISIITRSNDQRIYYIKQSGLGADVGNQIQAVAREVKGKQINFMDIMNYNTLVSKIGANKEIFMPVGRSNDRGIEFDTLQGQDIQMNTDLMEMLHTNAINGTGVPSVIMNYVNEADYAKSLVMGNTKFLGRAVSLQGDINPSVTELYKKIALYSGAVSEEDITILDKMMFTFNTPKALNTINMIDVINNADQLVNAMIKAKLGENTEATEKLNFIKDDMYLDLMRDNLPMIPWKRVNDSFDAALLKYTADSARKAAEGNQEPQ